MRIYIVYLLNVLTTASIWANRIFLALLAVKLGASPVFVGVLAAAFSLFPSLLAVTAGRLHDRLGSRHLLLFSSAVMSLGMLVPALWSSLASTIVAALACGLCSVFFNLCTQNLTGLLSTPETRTRNFSNYSLSNSVAHFLGPLISGFTIDQMSNTNTCLVLAAIAASPMLVLALWRRPLEPSHAASRQRGKGEDKNKAATSAGGAWAMLKDPNVRITLYTGCLLNAGLNLYQFYMPVYLHSLEISASVIGMVMSMYATAAFVVRLGLPRLIQKLKEHRVLILSFFLGACAIALIPFFHSPWLLAGMSFLFGLSMGIGHPVVTMQAFSNSPEGRSGEGLGLKMTTNNITKIVSPLVFGAVASAFGLGPMFWLNALLLGTGCWLGRPRRPRAATKAIG